MEILGYVGYAILCFLAVTWAIGIRVTLDASVATILTALFLVVSVLVIGLAGINKLNSFWIIAAGFLFSSLIAPLVLTFPLVSAPFRLLAGIFAGIMRIGIPKERIKEAQDARMQVEREKIEAFRSGKNNS